MFLNFFQRIPKTRNQRKREYLVYAAARAYTQCGGDGLGICKRVGIEVHTLHKISKTQMWQEALDFYKVKDREIRNPLYHERLDAYLSTKKEKPKREKIGDFKRVARIWTDLFSNGIPTDDFTHPELYNEEEPPKRVDVTA